ncbi:hypothetical protein [Ureibacillus acetophenoni]
MKNNEIAMEIWSIAFFVRRAVAPCATTAQDELLKVGGCYRGNNNSQIPEGSSSRR